MPPPSDHGQPPPPLSSSSSTTTTTSIHALALLPLLVLGALVISVALGRAPVLSAWPACSHLVEEGEDQSAAAAPTTAPAVPLRVPVFLTKADTEARRVALSGLKRAREAYRQELVVRMKALERMVVEQLPKWRGHARMPQLTASLQRAWEGEAGLGTRVAECWEGNERVLDRLLRLPEMTVGLPMPGEEEGPSSLQDDDEASSSGGGGGGGGGSAYSDGVQVLTHLLRDWAEEGRELRRRTYGPILRAVARLFPEGGARILVPGAGLGRLAFELVYGLQGRGHRVTALDLSPVMVAATASMLCLVLAPPQDEDEGPPPLPLRFYPFVHDPLINQRSSAARFRAVACPDAEAVAQARRRQSSSSASASLALELGDLLALAEAQPGAHDAVVTCFFIDTGKNPLDYVWAIRRLLRPGGVWVNLGPLNYHTTLLEGAVQLTLEELDMAATEMGLAPQRGFDLVPEPCAYRPEPFPGPETPAFLRSDVYLPAFGVYRREER